MREALKKLSGESLVYGLGQAGGRAVQLLLVPILTRALTPAAYGVSDLIVAYSQTVVLVLVFGMDGALARFFYQEPDRQARVRMVSTSLLFRVVTSVVTALALGLLAPMFAGALMSSAVYKKYVLIGAATIPFTLLVLFANDVLRVTFQPTKFIALNIAQTVLTGGAAIYLVVGRHLGVVGVLYGKLIADLLCALFGLVLIRHTIRPAFSREVLGRMLRLGAPLVPSGFAYGIILGVDRFVLQRTRSLDEVAVYAVAMKFFTIVTMGVSAFQLAYGPFAFARAREPDSPRLFARVFGLYVVAAGFAGLFVSVFAPEALAVLVPAQYRAAATPAAWLAFAAVAQGAYSVASIGVVLALRTAWLFWSSTAAAAVAIAMQFALTPVLGAPGAAIATFMGYATSALITYGIAQRFHPLPFHGGRMLAALALALGAGLLAQRYAPAGVLGIAVKLVALAAYAGACIGWQLWREREPAGAGPATSFGA
ncbi:MAG TPA: oligosaccharide flippase family protein [Candidatus Saccharimonadaceae bacterium]|jgi:O-antigen/teichoic acid export membrane protein|nr:oligosaccharide flippase family protein [Candidatus Saccharimonadaceae bacterium]